VRLTTIALSGYGFTKVNLPSFPLYRCCERDNGIVDGLTDILPRSERLVDSSVLCFGTLIQYKDYCLKNLTSEPHAPVSGTVDLAIKGTE
jgi:hypothetical protein